ncbi:hypothetical protein NQZ68_032362 [Dissostichus eleginoides]|nr:hypothetical protein NQZ68_032362 [Dissostichus eleginoides]
MHENKQSESHRQSAWQVISLSNLFEKAENSGLNQDKRREKKRTMKKTFQCDESMIITIPIGRLRDARELMPEKFHCVYKDHFKVFVVKGKPKPLGAAQAIAGVFILALGLVYQESFTLPYTLPSVLFLVCGMLSYAAGHFPNMQVTKLAFSLNIVGFFWSIAAVVLCSVTLYVGFGPPNENIYQGIKGLILTLLGVEMTMKKTFQCDESMIITIPIGRLRDARELMPEKFHCVYKDHFKVFVVKGKPKPLGAAQAIAGVFILALGLVYQESFTLPYTLPSVLFLVCGMLSYAAGHFPNMQVTKLAFSLNIVSFFWSIAAVVLCSVTLYVGFGPPNENIYQGIKGLILTLLGVEMLTSLFLIYWLSHAVCRQHFNTLPTIRLKQGD